MRISLFFGLLLMSIVFVRCVPEPTSEETGTVVFNFKAVYDEKPLKIFDIYTYPQSDYSLYFTRLSYYISDLTIRSAEGDVVLKDVDYLNLTNAHVDKNNDNGLQYKITGVKPGDYTSIDFGFGLPAALNAKHPRDFEPRHVLNNSAEYWTPWKSYIFFRPEGKIDFGNGLLEDFALHLGGDESFIKIIMNKPIKVEVGKESPVDVIIDMKKFFDANSLYDIKSTLQIHSLDKKPQMMQLVENLALSIK
jgi:hypothetical protein